MNRALLSLCLVLTAAPFAGAHPVPKNNHDRTVIVRLTPRSVVVEYRLELDDLTAVSDLPRSEWADLKERRDIYPVFLRYFAPVLADNVVASLDGRPLPFVCVSKQFKELDHLRCDYRFEAKWEPEPGKEHTFSLREGNYELDSASKLLLSLAGEDALAVRRATVPGADLQAKAPEDRGPGEGERLRTVSATFVVEPEPPLAAYKGGLPPDLGPDRAGPAEGQTVGVLKSAGHGEAAAARAGRADQESPGAAKGGPIPRSATGGPMLPVAPDNPAEVPPSSHSKALDLLFKSRSGIWMALLAAAGLGAVHALTPGHGKTLVAAYLVGERGTVWHAVLLGVVTTLTHTAAVLALATVAWLLKPELVPAVEMVLSLVGGLMVAGLGLWLLTRRLSGRADHFHLGGGAHNHGDGDHGHVHSHGAASAEEGVGWRPLVWLGVSGGVVPCGEAFVLLIAAVSAGQPQLGLPLLLAFSAGLTSVLVAIGIGVVYAKRHLAARVGDSERLRKVVRALPLISAVAVTALGLWLCYDGVRGLK